MAWSIIPIFLTIQNAVSVNIMSELGTYMYLCRPSIFFHDLNLNYFGDLFIQNHQFVVFYAYFFFFYNTGLPHYNTIFWVHKNGPCYKQNSVIMRLFTVDQ